MFYDLFLPAVSFRDSLNVIDEVGRKTVRWKHLSQHALRLSRSITASVWAKASVWISFEKFCSVFSREQRFISAGVVLSADLWCLCLLQVYTTNSPNGTTGKTFKVHLQLWDTAGQERCALFSSYSLSAPGFPLCPYRDAPIDRPQIFVIVNTLFSDDSLIETVPSRPLLVQHCNCTDWQTAVISFEVLCAL